MTHIMKPRRAFITAAAPIGLAILGMPGRNAYSKGHAKANMAEKLKWIQDWSASLETERGGPLILQKFKDDYWALRQQISWEPNESTATSLKSVVVPIGFVTDLASVPQAFFSILPSTGPYGYAAVVHDYLYWTQTTTRAEADLVLKLAMDEFGVAAWQNAAISRAVGIFGQRAWNANSKARASGERRVLAKFPDDARITFKDWCKQDVFLAVDDL